jgi:hypothetical protein
VRIRDAAALLAACTVHGGALAGLAAAKQSVPTYMPNAAPIGEIDLDPPLADDEGPIAKMPDPLEGQVLLDRGARHLGGGAWAKSKSREVDPAKRNLASEPPPADGWYYSPFTVRIDATHAFTPDFPQPASRPADAAAPAPTSTTGGVAEGLAARDVDAGLGRGGSVLTAAEGAARSAEAPLRGDATFDVVVRPDGRVQANLASASTDVDAWRGVAGVLQRSIDGRHVRLPPGSRGLHVVVRVEAKVLLADGRDTGSLHGLRGGVMPSALSNAIEGKPGARGSSTGPGGPDHVNGEGGDAPPLGGALGPEKPRNVGGTAAVGVLMRVLPTPTLSVEGKVCGATVAITPLGIGVAGGCGFENIGNGTHRAVSGRILKEEAL